MTKETSDKLNMVKEKLNYIGLNLEEIPEFLRKNEQLEFKTIHENEFKKYKVYKFIDVRDIQILITPKNRLDPIMEKQKQAKRIINYLEPKEEEDIPLQAEFLQMLNKVEIQDIEKIDELQKAINKKIPFKVEYENNFLWEIYYSEVYKKYFMLVPLEDSDYSSLFYLLKKQIEANKRNRASKIFVPICFMEYTGVYLKKTEIADIENSMWLFAGDWPNIYEVFDKKDVPTIQIIGKTFVYDNLTSDYKITLKTKEDAIKFYKYIKALFILQSELPHKYKFIPKIDRYGSLDLYYDDKKINYEDLPEFIKKEYDNTTKELEQITTEVNNAKEEIEEKKKISKQKEKEYFQKEKEITLYLECKKSFFGKIKYFFKHKKMVKQINKEEEETEKTNIEKETYSVEEKQYYNIEDLININKRYNEIDLEYKNLKLDIEALDEKISMMERKIKNAILYIEEIDKHNKSIFEFWKFTNKDEKQALAEGTGEAEETENMKIEKTFKIETDFEEFSIRTDSNQRKKLTKEQCDAIFLTQTNILEQLNIIKSYVGKDKKISKKDEAIIKIKLEMLQEEANKNQELFEKEEFDIFGGLSEDHTKIKYLNGKKHRETERNKFKILDLNKNTKPEEYIQTLKKCIEEIQKALETNTASVSMPIYKVTEQKLEEKNFEIFNINIENTIEKNQEDKLNLYKINIKEMDNIVYLTNIVYYNNNNETLPLGMDVTDKALVDLNGYELELVNKETIKLNEQEGLYNKVKTINVYEYDISKN